MISQKLSVCVLTRMAQMITTTHRDLQSCMPRPTDDNKPKLGQSVWVDLVYLFRKSSGLCSCPVSWASKPMGCLFFIYFWGITSHTLSVGAISVYASSIWQCINCGTEKMRWTVNCGLGHNGVTHIDTICCCLMQVLLFVALLVSCPVGRAWWC